MISCGRGVHFPSPGYPGAEREEARDGLSLGCLRVSVVYCYCLHLVFFLGALSELLGVFFMGRHPITHFILYSFCPWVALSVCSMLIGVLAGYRDV